MEDLQRRSGEKADFFACQAFGKPSYHFWYVGIDGAFG